MNFYFLKYFIILYLLLFNIYAKDLKKFTLQLSWFNQFQFAGYYIAKEKGFYKEVGLDVEILPFDFGLNVPKMLDDGKVDFAVGRENLILEKSKGKDIKVLYALFQATPLILISTEKSKIKNIEDFKNKRIMITKDDSEEISVKAMIQSKKMKLEDLKFLDHTHNIEDLINNKTDVISAYISKSPYFLEKRKIPYNTFAPMDYGFAFYSDFLYTSSSLIKKMPQEVENFREASLKGWKYAYENIKETANLIHKKYNSQSLTKEELIYEGEELKKLSYYKTNQLGDIKKENLQRIFDLYNILGLTNKVVNFDDFIYDNNLLLNEEEMHYLKNKDKINLCISPKALPYSGIVNAEAKGLVADYIKLLEKKLKKRLTLVQTTSWEETMEFMKNRKCDILGVATQNNSRIKYLNFTKPYFSVTSVLVTRSNIPYVENLVNLKNIKIGIIKKSGLIKRLRTKYPNIDFIEVDSVNEGLKMVDEKKLFGQITLLKGVWQHLEKQYIAKLKISSIIGKKNLVRIAIRNDDEMLTNIFNKIVNTTIGTKDLDEIKSKWLSINTIEEFDYGFLYKILFIIAIILLFILYRQKILKEINITLNEKVREKTKQLEEINNSLEIKIQKAVEENLQKDSLLAQQSKMISMGQMIENIAHQWRQPLSLISISASGLKLKKELDELDDKVFDRTVDSIINSTSYLSNTIEDFMNFFKPHKEKKIFNIKDSLEKSLYLLKSRFQSEDIIIIKNLKDVQISGYENEFMQVIINLLTNAKDALVSNNIKKKFIFLQIIETKENLTINVKDNAGGIKKEIIDKIFEPYFTTKHKSKGTGIGLYMSNIIIERYLDGRIEVKNDEFTFQDEKYKGALFSIIISKEKEEIL